MPPFFRTVCAVTVFKLVITACSSLFITSNGALCTVVPSLVTIWAETSEIFPDVVKYVLIWRGLTAVFPIVTIELPLPPYICPVSAFILYLTVVFWTILSLNNSESAFFIETASISIILPSLATIPYAGGAEFFTALSLFIAEVIWIFLTIAFAMYPPKSNSPDSKP